MQRRGAWVCAAALLLAAHVSATEIYPLEQVRKGLKGQGVTVIASPELTRFGVTVLGVLPDFIGPGQDLILARLDGPEIEYHGVISGMSGSPVYVDGKLLGAVAYRLGAFSKEPIAGITPAALMLAAASPPASRASPRAALDPGVDAPLLRPIDTPLVVAGAPEGLLEHYTPRLRAHGLTPVRGGASSTAARPASGQPFVPGGAMAGVLVDGDLSLAATGTVTAVDGLRVIGFGHPFLGRGSSAIPLATADIVATLPSLAGSSKIGVVTGVVGTLHDDRSTAVVGQVGALPALATLRVELAGDPALLGHDARQALRFGVFHDPALTPLFMELAAASALGSRVGFDTGGSARLQLHIRAAGRPELRIEDSVSVGDAGSVAAEVARVLAGAVTAIWTNPFEPVRALDVVLRVELEREPHQATLVSARLSPPSLRPGQSASVELQLQDFRGQLRHLRQPVRAPVDEEAGTLKLVIGGDEALANLDRDAGRERVPASLDDLLSNLRQRRRSDRLYLVLVREDGGLRVDGTTLPGLPPSLQGRLGRGSDGPRRGNLSQRVVREQVLDLGLVVQGQVALEMELLPEDPTP